MRAISLIKPHEFDDASQADPFGGAFIIEPNRFDDECGYFERAWTEDELAEVFKVGPKPE